MLSTFDHSKVVRHNLTMLCSKKIIIIFYLKLILFCKPQDKFSIDDWQNQFGQKKISESEQGSTSAPCRQALTNLIAERRRESYSLAEHRDKVSRS